MLKIRDSQLNHQKLTSQTCHLPAEAEQQAHEIVFSSYVVYHNYFVSNRSLLSGYIKIERCIKQNRKKSV